MKTKKPHKKNRVKGWWPWGSYMRPTTNPINYLDKTRAKITI